MSRSFSASLALLAVLAAAFQGAWAGAAGLSALPELDVPSSAISAAAGPAGGGLVDDASAVLENPARMGVSGSAGFAATHVAWVEGLSDSHLDGYLKQEGIGVLGGYLRLFRGDFTGTSETYAGDYMGSDAGYVYRTVSAGFGIAPDVSLLRDILGLQELRAGAGAGMVRREMVREVDYGLGLTLAAEAGFEDGWSAYARARNLGTLSGDLLPFSAGAGGVKRIENVLIPEDRGAIAAEATLAREDGAGASLAVEYVVRWLDMETGLRAGYLFTGADSASSLPTGGILIRLGTVSLDLGIVSLGDLGVVEVVTLSFQERDAAGER